MTKNHAKDHVKFKTKPKAVTKYHDKNYTKTYAVPITETNRCAKHRAKQSRGGYNLIMPVPKTVPKTVLNGHAKRCDKIWHGLEKIYQSISVTHAICTVIVPCQNQFVTVFWLLSMPNLPCQVTVFLVVQVVSTNETNIVNGIVLSYLVDVLG